LEESTVLIIEKELIDKLSKNNPQFIDFNTQLQSNSARERYLDFIKTYPDRVRKELATKHQDIT